MFVMQAVPRASAIIVTLALTFGALDDAHAIDCHAKRGAGHPWAYRQVDGKRCWYNGRPGVNKKLLRWAKAQSPPKSEHTTTEGQRPIEDSVPVEWPQLPPLPTFMTFDERWCALCLRGIP